MKILGLYKIRERRAENFFEVTLPVQWIREKKFSKGDTVVIIENDRGELVIRRPTLEKGNGHV